jgi:hypothetical protein
MESEKLLNSDGTITILGTAYDFPSRNELTKWDYKTSGKEVELWISAYVHEGAAVFRMQSCLTRGTRGKLELDGKPLKGEDREKAELIFGNLEK